jgi:hypothetical protein
MKAAALVLLLGPMSCKDFDLVGPSPNLEPWLFVGVFAEHDSGSRYTVNAVFHPGSDASGNAKPYLDRSLLVETLAIGPQASSDEFQWFYGTQLNRPAVRSQVDTLKIRPPVPQDVFLTPSVAVPIPAREDPEEVVLPAGQDLRLHVSSVAGDSTALAGGTDSWQLALRESCSTAESGTVLNAQGSGAYPTELRVPWEWIANAQGRVSHACFLASARYEGSGVAYRTRVHVGVRISWRIRIISPAP